VLSGGVGGAKLVLGLSQCLSAEQLQVVANTGDDFNHLGLPISPDLDTLMYTLADIANPDTGWGLRDESWDFMAALSALNGPTWFQLGDRDLGTHAQRRELLIAGKTLSEATQTLFNAAGVAIPVWPMSDSDVRTIISSESQDYDFQSYFVEHQAAPVATGFRYATADDTLASAGALAALSQPDLDAIIISPSNPWLSIDPILSLSDIRTAISNNKAPVIGVSPIVGGRAIKGPTAKLMQELGLEVSALGVARHYQDILDGFIIDTQDAAQRAAIEELGISVGITNTVMQNLNDKRQLAGFAIDFAGQLSSNG
jgi:LPPG:FO 2-phospho-L-lactate transferase